MGNERSILERLTTALSDSQEVDWSTEHQAATDPEEARVIRNLQFLSRVAEANRQVLSQSRDLPFVTWGHLRLVERVGSGGYGEVFRAWEDVLHREVALKLFAKAPDEENGDRMDRLLEEARHLANLRHENLVRVYGAEVHHGRVGFWMEFVQGETLEGILRRQGPMDAIEASNVGIKLARALGALHKAGVLHRDIKAENVIREVGGHLYLVDLGAGTTDETIQRQGTPAYMAPEVLLEGRSSKPADIYSLGVLLFRCVTGNFPVEAASIAEFRAAHRAAQRPSLGELRPNLPAAFRRVVERCLEVDPAKRFGSASEVEDALMESLTVRRGGVRRLHVTLLAVLLAAVGTWIIPRMLKRSANSPSRILVLPLEVRGEGEGSEYVGLAIAQAIAANLSRAADLIVLPVPEKVPADAANRPPMDLARELGATSVLTGTLTRNGAATQASVSLLDVVENRVMWGTQWRSEQGSYSSLTSSVARDVEAQLGGKSPRLYGYPDDLTGGPEMATSKVFSEYVNASRGSSAAATAEASERLLEAFPNEIDAHVLRTKALVDAWDRDPSPGNEMAALTSIASLSRVDPNNPYSEIYLAVCERITGKIPVAVARLEKVLSRSDLSPSARAWALRQCALGTRAIDLNRALMELEESLILDPTNSNTYASLGLVLGSLGRPEQALVRAEQAVILSPMNWQHRAALGISLDNLGRFEEAAKAESIACEQSDNQNPCALLAMELHRAGHEAAALSVANKAAALTPSGIGAFSLACYWTVAGNRSNAIRCLRDAVNLGWSARIRNDPDFASLHGDPEFEAIAAENDKLLQGSATFPTP